MLEVALFGLFWFDFAKQNISSSARMITFFYGQAYDFYKFWKLWHRASRKSMLLTYIALLYAEQLRWHFRWTFHGPSACDMDVKVFRSSQTGAQNFNGV